MADNLPPVILSTGTNNFNQDPRKYYQQIEATVANLKARGHDVHMIIPRDSVHGGTSQEHQFSQGPAQVARAIAQKYNLPTYNFQGNVDKVHPDGKEYETLVNQINQNTGGQANKALYVGDSIAVGLGQAAKGNTNYASGGKDANWILNRVGGPPEGYNNQNQPQGRSQQQTNLQANNGQGSGYNPYRLIPSNGNLTTSTLGLNQNHWDAYRSGLTQLEMGSKANYGRIGGYNNAYNGQYQFGNAAMKTAANVLGERPPSRQEFLRDPSMQERYLDALTYANHNTLMRNSRYRNLPPEQQLQVLGYAHNQGAGGASKWLNTGVAGRDGFGTSGTAYNRAVAAHLARANQLPAVAAAGGLAGQQYASLQGNTMNDASAATPNISQNNQPATLSQNIIDQINKQREFMGLDPKSADDLNKWYATRQASINSPTKTDPSIQGGTTVIPKPSDSGKITDRLPADDLIKGVVDPSKSYAGLENNPYKFMTKGINDLTNTSLEKYNSLINGTTTNQTANQSNTSADDLSKRLSTMKTNIQQQVAPAFKDLADKSQDFYNKELAPTVNDTIDKINKNAPTLIQKGKDALGPSAVSATNKTLDALSPGAAAATPPNNGSPTSIDMGDMWKKTQANGQAMLQQGKDKLLSPGLKSLSTPGAQASIPSNGGLSQSGSAASTSGNSFAIDPKGRASSMNAITPDGKLQNNVPVLGGLIKIDHSIDAAKKIQQHPDFNTLPPGVQSHVNSAASGKTNLDLNVMQPHFDKLNPDQIKQMADNGIQINIAPQQSTPAAQTPPPSSTKAPDPLAQKVTDPSNAYKEINPITPKVELPKVELPKVELPPTPKVDTVPPPEDNKPVDLPKQPDLEPAPASPIKSSSDNYSSATEATDSGTSAWTPGKGDPGDKTSAPTDEEDELDKLLEQYQEFKFVY